MGLNGVWEDGLTLSHINRYKLSTRACARPGRSACAERGRGWGRRGNEDGSEGGGEVARGQGEGAGTKRGVGGLADSYSGVERRAAVEEGASCAHFRNMY